MHDTISTHDSVVATVNFQVVLVKGLAPGFDAAAMGRHGGGGGGW